MTGNKIRAAIYCRLSREDKNKTNENDDSESIQHQKDMLLREVLERGWCVYDIYSDDDFSGMLKERPDFKRLLEDAESGKFDVVIAKTQSRFTRSMETVEQILHDKFNEWGIRFIGIVDHADTDDKGNKKSRQINGLVNEWYIEDVSLNIRSAFKTMRENGQHIGAYVRYGYKKDPNNKNHLIIDEPAAKIVRRIYKLYLSGKGPTEIARILTADKVLTPEEYKQQNVDSRYKIHNSKNKGWTIHNVAKILREQIYIGDMVQGRQGSLDYKHKKILSIPKDKWIIKEGTHEAIINKEDFNRVQKMLEDKRKSGTKKEAHIFSSKVFCMDCGETMQKYTTNNGTIIRLCCAKNKKYPNLKKKEKCYKHNIRLDELTKIVTERIKEKIQGGCDFKLIENNLTKINTVDSDIKQLEKEKVTLLNEIKSLENIIQSTYMDKVEGIITPEQFLDFNADFLERKKSKVNELKKVETKLNEKRDSKNNTEENNKIIKKYKNFNELTFEIIQAFVDYIEIGERTSRSAKQLIKIHWNF